MLARTWWDFYRERYLMKYPLLHLHDSLDCKGLLSLLFSRMENEKKILHPIYRQYTWLTRRLSSVAHSVEAWLGDWVAGCSPTADHIFVKWTSRGTGSLPGLLPRLSKAHAHPLTPWAPKITAHWWWVKFWCFFFVNSFLFVFISWVQCVCKWFLTFSPC